MASTYDGSLIFDTHIDTEGFSKGTNTIRSQANGLKSTLLGLGKTIGMVFGVTELIRFGKQAIDTASDIEEVQNVVDTAFGSMRSSMEEFAQSSVKTYGMSKLTAKEMGSTFMSMAKNMVSSTKTATEMSLALTGLAGDWASFYNVTQSESATALNSIFTGETENIKRYGYILTEANLQNFAYEQGIKKKISAMTQEEKVLLRYNYIMQKSAMVQGDFAKTSDSWANQTRVLSEQWKELLGILGGGLINVFAPTVRLLNSALSKIIDFANGVSVALAEVFGFEKTTVSISNNADAIGDASDGISQVGDAIKDASKAAKSGVAPFDQLNNIASELADSSSDINLGGTGSTNDIVVDKEAAKEASKYEKIIKGLGEQLIEFGKSLSNLKTALEPFAKGVYRGFTEFMGEALEYFGKGIVAALDGIGKGVDWIATAVGKVNPNILENAGVALGKILAAVLLVKGATTLGSILVKIGTGIAKILSGVSKYSAVFAIVSGPFIAEFFASLFSSVTSAEKDALNGAIDDLNASMDDLDLAIERAKSNYTNLQNENRTMQITVDAYFELANKDFLTDKEEEQLKSYAKLLREKFPDELNGIIDEHTGKYQGTEQAIRDMIKAHQDYVLEVAAEEALIDISKKVIDAQRALDKLEEERIKANQIWREKRESLPDAINDPSKGLIQGSLFNFFMSGEEQHLRRANEAWSEGKKNLQNAQEEMKFYKDEIVRINQDLVSNFETTAVDSETSLGGMSKAMDDYYTKMDTTSSDKSASIADGPSKIVKAYEDNLLPFSTAADQLYQELVDKMTPAEEDIPEVAKNMLAGFKKKIEEGKPGVIQEMGKVLASLETQVENTKTKNVKTIGEMMKAMQSKIDLFTLSGPVLAGFLATSGVPLPKQKFTGLATGTVVPANYGDFLARLGDNTREPEVVSPISTMRKAFRDELSENGGFGSGEITLIVNLEGKQIYKEVVKQDKEMRNRVGYSELAY